MCAVHSKPFYDIPYLPRKMILDSMSPFEVLQLSLSSTKTYNMLCWMKLEAKFDLTVTKEHVIITARTIHGVESKMFIGKTNEKATSTFNCSFDKEFFFGCQTTAAGFVYPYGLDTILGRLFRIFPKAGIANVNIEKKFGTSDADFATFTRALENLLNKPRVVPVYHLNILTNWDFVACEATKKIASLLKKEPEYKQPPKETSFPINNYLNMGLRKIRIPASTLHDGHFNRILRKWCSSVNTHLRRIAINTDEISRAVDLLRELPQIERRYFARLPGGRFDIYTIQRPTDGRKALIMRSNTKLMLCVEADPFVEDANSDEDFEDDLEDFGDIW